MRDRRRGFWSDRTIKARQRLEMGRQQPLISPYKPERVQPASYRLRVGNEIYISSPAKDGKYPTRERLREGEARAIPPGQFAFLITDETVHMPKDALGLITLRLKPTKFKGIVNVSGFHVDPTYKGRLVFAVYNAGPSPVQVACGDEWFELFFCYLDRPYNGPAKTDGLTTIPSEILLPGPVTTMEMLRDEVDAIEDRLDERLQRVERENGILRWAVTLIVGALIAFAIRSCNPETAIADTPVAPAVQN